MAAFAALSSLMYSIKQIQYHRQSPSSLEKNLVESLTETVTFWQNFIGHHFHGRFAKEAYSLEKIIADAAHDAEFIIESHLRDQWSYRSTNGDRQMFFEYRLRKVVGDMAIIKRKVSAIEIEYDEERSIQNQPFILQLIRDISKAVSQRESVQDYKKLLKKIFEDRYPSYDEALAHAEVPSNEFPYETVFGRDYEVKLLLSNLIELHEKESQLSVIPILGDSGIGKTTLARVVYEDESVKEHFELRVWVNVESREFNLKHVARGILKSAMSMDCSLDDLDELDELVRESLPSQRCLIVFDGIESISKDSWLHMNRCWFNLLDLGSKVLITTTSQDVANLVAKQAFPLLLLSENDGLSLCRYVAFDGWGGILHTMPPMFKNLAFVCLGIPLLLKVFGSLIRHDRKMRDILYWMSPEKKFMLFQSWNASATILLCLWSLPPHLRQCLAYCAIFPKRYVFNKEKIIYMWIAAGFVKGNNLVDIGNTYFHQLLYRLFFTDIIRDQYDDIIEFQIPSLIHEMAEDVARIVFKEKLGLICSVGEDAAQLSLVSPFAGKFKSEHLRSLILSPTLYVGGNLDHALLDFQELRSLDLSCSGIRSLSDDICVLKELRYVNLSYTLIERLPDSITDLSSLQTLDLSWCYHLKVLPKGLRNLRLMSHLDLSRCESLSYFPSGIGSLESLSSMPLFVLGKDQDCAGLQELGKLNQLEGKLEIRNLENVINVFEARDAKLYQKRLQHLELSWSQNLDDCYKLLELLEPNQQLKVLHLTGYMSYKFPKWISSTNCLIKISITHCGCQKLPSLGQLPFLKELQLKQMINLVRIGREVYGHGIDDVAFQSLEQLELYDLPRLIEWSIDSNIRKFPTLESLTIQGCPELRYLPSFYRVTDMVVSNSRELGYGLGSTFSLLISDMEVKYWYPCDVRNKLIFCNIHNKFIVFPRVTWNDTIEQLDILHCNQLIDMDISTLSFLKKLHVGDCQNLRKIKMVNLDDCQLMELVFEDCPELEFDNNISYPRLLSRCKMTVRNCSNLANFVAEMDLLDKLQYLSVDVQEQKGVADLP